MEVILSDTMGYCGGVSRAIGLVETALELAGQQGRPVYSVGNIIHNEQVCDSLARRGLVPIESPDGHEPGIVVLRAHGVPDSLRFAFSDAGFTIIDAACPVVQRNLALIAEYCKDRQVLVVGKQGHPETVAMQGVWCDGAVCPTTLVSDASQVASLRKGIDYAVFVQTTFGQRHWQEIKAALAKTGKDGNSFLFANEICPSSINRRNALLRLCSCCEAIVVVGGKNSANTQALAALASRQGRKVWHIETVDEVTDEMLAYSRIGVTAGASTPPSTIEAIREKLTEGRKA
jgi:4-hydroxy-3-methylbut-2-enyl diphosphate reductase